VSTRTLSGYARGPNGSGWHHSPHSHRVSDLLKAVNGRHDTLRASSCTISYGLGTVLALPGGQAAVELGKAVRQLRDVPEDTIAVRTEHSRQVDGTLAIDREAEEMNIL
jgi:hypothetical protein